MSTINSEIESSYDDTVVNYYNNKKFVDFILKKYPVLNNETVMDFIVQLFGLKKYNRHKYENIVENTLKLPENLKMARILKNNAMDEMFHKMQELEQENINAQNRGQAEQNDNHFRQDILNLLRQGTHGKNTATEMISQRFRNNFTVYTIRDDKYCEMWIYDNGIYIPQAKTYIEEFVRYFLRRNYTTTFTNQVVAKIQVDTYIKEEDFFKEEPPYLVPVKNGILNILTRELYPFNSKYKFFNKINAEYIEEADCPNIKEHLKNVLAKEEDIKTIQETIGYCMYRNYKFEKGWMFTGRGRNGKGKTLELIKTFLNPKNCCNVSLQQIENSEFVLGEFHRKLANLCSDMSKTALKETGLYKQLTGHDMLSANRKFLPMIHFVNYAKMIFLANQIPETYDKTLAFFDRWLLIDFPYTFKIKTEYDKLDKETIKKEKIKLANEEIIEKLTTPEEMNGLLKFALDGLDRLFKNRGFTKSTSTKEIEAMWLRKSSSASAFIMDEIKYEWGSTISKTAFRDEYMKYCEKHNLKMQTDKQIKFHLVTEVNASETQKGTDKEHKWNNITWVSPEGKIEEKDEFEDGNLLAND